MRAVTVSPEHTLLVTEVPDPVPGSGEVLVRVAGAGVNAADLLQRAGLYPAPPGSPADVPGLEFAGEVVAHGPGVTEPALGALVMGIAGGGAQAELLAVPAPQCAPIPDGLELVAAGGVPEAFVTAHDALCTQAGLRPGETLLVHAVGSGVGTAALQLARAMGCRVIGTSRTPAKLARAAELGLDHGVATGDVDPRALAAEIRSLGGADVVLDLVGGPYVEADVAAASPRGRIVLVGTLAGGRATLDVLAVMTKRLRIHGTVLRSRSVEEKGAALAACMTDLARHLASGRVQPVVDATFPLDEADAAYQRLADADVFGKVVLTPGPH